MARAIVSAAIMLVAFVRPALADDSSPSVPDEISAVADEAGVDPLDLLGAMDSTGHEMSADGARDYLWSVGELARPVVPVPIVSNARVDCIMYKESGGANVANSRGSGAGGVMQYMPGTFYAHAAEMGHYDWSLWNPAQARAVAAYDLAMGRRTQWTVPGC